MFEKEWVVTKYDQKEISDLSKKLNISPVLAKLLTKRGYTNAEIAENFLKKDFSFFHSPFLMKDMEKGAKLLAECISLSKKILIWGDYDVDGVTSVTLLLKYIKSLGATCDYYIPKRTDDGYGLNDKVINEYIKKGFGLIITVDSGITATNEIANAKAQGINVIVTDHHECRDKLPDADAVINPKRPDCNYPFKELAGVGVAFKFACAAEMIISGITHADACKKLINAYSEFIAIGTIADVMPICDENRIIVAKGLDSIANTKNLGLEALIEESGLNAQASPKKKKITSVTVGFILAPRINAAGRMETSKIAVDLFMSQSQEEAAQLAHTLGEINKRRQLLENESLTLALDKIHTQCNIQKDKILVLDDDTWHHGIIGIVASRITEKYNLPSILISFKNEIPNSDPEIGKGSARSIKGMNLVKSLASCNELLQKFGGHELAAGLSIKRSDLSMFRTKINEYAKKAFENVNLKKTLDIDCELNENEITIKLANEIGKLEPFGLSNNVPIFSCNDMQISSIIPIGDGKHTKIGLEKNGFTVMGLLFGTPTNAFHFTNGDSVDVAFNLDINNFKNQQSIQMIIRDIIPNKHQRDIISQHIYKYESMTNDQLCKISSHEIPTRTDFARLYTALKDILQAKETESEYTEIYIPKLLKGISRKYSASIPLYKALIIFDVLYETNLTSENETIAPITRNVKINPKYPESKKVILENAPTIKKLFSKII